MRELKTAIRLLLVDDHEVVRVGLKTVLSRVSDFQVIGEVGTMKEAITASKRLEPTVVLMDIRLPDGSAVEACRDILAEIPTTRVLFLTSYANAETVQAAVLAGAHGYVLKEIGSKALIESIKTVATGQSILDPSVTRQVFSWMKTLPNSTLSSTPPSLSPQEKRIVALIAEGKTNKEIALSMGLSHKTVKNYLANIFEKLGITRRTQAAALVGQQPKNRAFWP